MKIRRPFLVLWIVIILALLFVEIAEVTSYFTLPITSVVGNPIAFVFVLAFTTVLALVGAVFIGLYLAQRWLSTSDFTPFELEMLKMRDEIKTLQHSVDELKEVDARHASDGPTEGDETR